MAGSGRISLLVSKDLQTVAIVAAALEPELSKQLRAHTRSVAEPVWQEEVRSRAETRLQHRSLVDTARVSVSNTNVTVKSATIGRLSSGTPASVVAAANEFGANEDTLVQTRSRKGTPYRRRLGSAFPRPRRRGYVVFESVRDSAARLASLWAQTTYRTVADLFERGHG